MTTQKSSIAVPEAEGRSLGPTPSRAADPSSTVIIPTVTPDRVLRLLASLSDAAGSFETIVVDNGTGSMQLKRLMSDFDGGELLSLRANLGYSRAVNLAARQAQGDVLVLLNDDCVVEDGYVERIVEPLDPDNGIVMATGVMRDAGHPGLIETAGVEVDRTLLPFDYLNGEPVDILAEPLPDPIGPSGAGAAFWRDAFLDVGGFDEALFAYFEDVDLALRIRLAGGSCRLAPRALGTHEHSATLGPGSRRKDYLIGFGRGYLLRKWGVLSARRLPGVVLRELAWCTGQLLWDRNLGAISGRLDGLRAQPDAHRYPDEALTGVTPLPSTVSRHLRRRVRIRRRFS